tara:strand:- start:354 stop:731 length:378 start_codon:yes stop_codon:yes gene_type:complete
MKKNFTSNKSFGILLFSILLIFHIIFYKFNYSIILPIATLILILSYLKPNFFKYPKEIWIKFGVILGKFLNPIICLILYFLVIGITKILLDLFMKKLIQKKSNSKIKSNWILRKDETYLNLNNQF